MRIQLQCGNHFRRLSCATVGVLSLAIVPVVRGETLRSLVTGSQKPSWSVSNVTFDTFQAEFRLENVQPDSADRFVFGDGDWPLLSCRIPPGSLDMTCARSSDGAGSGTWTVHLTAGQDVRVRYRRDAKNAIGTVETWAGDCSAHALVQRPISFVAPPVLVNGPMKISSNLQVAFLRLSSTLDAAGDCPQDAPAQPADMADFRFENDSPADASPHAYTMLAPGSQFVDSLTYPPLAVISGWTAPKPVFPAGLPFTLDGRQSYSTNGPITGYSWTQIAGPNQAAIASPANALTSVTAPAGTLGQYTFRLTIQTPSSSASVDQVVGVVNADAKGIVTPPGDLGTILGPVLLFGASPWPWYDATLAADVDFIAPYWTTPPAVTARPGTLSITSPPNTIDDQGHLTAYQTSNPGVIITGTGTAFDASLEGTFIGVRWDPDGTGANGEYSFFAVTHVFDATHLAVNNYYITQPPAKMVNLAWVAPEPGALTGWRTGNYTNHYDFYEAGLAAYRLYYRTGLTAYRETARAFCQNWWTYSLDSGYATPRSLDAGYQFMMACAADNFPLAGGGTSALWWDRLAGMVTRTGQNTMRGGLTPATKVTPPVGDTRESSYVTRFTALMARVYPRHAANPTEARATWCGALAAQVQNFWSSYTALPEGDAYWEEDITGSNPGYTAASIPPGVPGAHFGTSPWRSSGLSSIALIYAREALADAASCNADGANTTLANSLLNPATHDGLIAKAAQFVWDYGRSPDKGLFYDLLYESNPSLVTVGTGGPLSVQNGSKTITGAGTSFTSLYAPCDGTTYIGLVSPQQKGNFVFRVESCLSDTQLVINTPYPWASDGLITYFTKAPASSTDCGPYSIAPRCTADPYSGRNLSSDIMASAAWLYGQTGDPVWMDRALWYGGSAFGGCPAGAGGLCTPDDLAVKAGPYADGKTGNLGEILPLCQTQAPPCGGGALTSKYGKPIGMAAGAGNVDLALTTLPSAFDNGTSPPTIVSFAAAPSSINAGQKTALQWIVLRADELSIDQGIGDVTGAAAAAIAPSRKTTYTLTAKNKNGSSYATASVAINGNAVISSGSTLGSRRVYPNPWRKDRQGNGPIKFDQLPGGSSIAIFTVSGRRVKSLDASLGHAEWDLTNDDGSPVASGIYFYLIKDPQGEKARGPLAVLR